MREVPLHATASGKGSETPARRKGKGRFRVDQPGGCGRSTRCHPRPFVGVFQSQFAPGLSTWDNNSQQNGSKNGETAPRPGTGYPHEGPSVGQCGGGGTQGGAAGWDQFHVGSCRLGGGAGGAERTGPTCGVVDEHLRRHLQAAIPLGEIVHVHCPQAKERRRVVVVLPRGGLGLGRGCGEGAVENASMAWIPPGRALAGSRIGAGGPFSNINVQAFHQCCRFSLSALGQGFWRDGNSGESAIWGGRNLARVDAGERGSWGECVSGFLVCLEGRGGAGRGPA